MTGVWAIATLVQVILPGHIVPLPVNAIMGTVAASFFGGAVVIARRRGGNGNGNGIGGSQ